MSNDKQVEEQIRAMAKLSLLSNKINSIQEKNLKLFPMVFFQGISSIIIDYDFSNTKPIDFDSDKENIEVTYKFDKFTPNFRVTYKIQLNETLNNYLEKRFKALEQSVRGLFWKETKVEVYFNDRLVFESEPYVRESNTVSTK